MNTFLWSTLHSSEIISCAILSGSVYEPKDRLMKGSFEMRADWTIWRTIFLIMKINDVFCWWYMCCMMHVLVHSVAYVKSGGIILILRYPGIQKVFCSHLNIYRKFGTFEIRDAVNASLCFQGIRKVLDKISSFLVIVL